MSKCSICGGGSWPHCIAMHSDDVPKSYQVHLTQAAYVIVKAYRAARDAQRPLLGDAFIQKALDESAAYLAWTPKQRERVQQELERLGLL